MRSGGKNKSLVSSSLPGGDMIVFVALNVGYDDNARDLEVTETSQPCS